MPELEADFKTETLNAITALKDTVKNYGKDSSDYKNNMEKVNKQLDTFEVISQKYTVEQATLRKESTELKELFETLKKTATETEEDYKKRIAVVEDMLARKENSSNDPFAYRQEDDFKAYDSFCKIGYENLKPEQKALMRTDVGSDGGFLVPVELDTQLRKEIVEISPIRTIARVRTMAGKTLEIAIRTTNLQASYEGETEDVPTDSSKYRNVTITPYRQGITIPLTNDLAMDSAFNIEAEINTDVATAFARGEGLNFVLGDGIKKPEGFLTNTDIAVSDTATSGVLAAKDILRQTGKLKQGYDATWVMNRRTLAEIRTEQSASGGFLWLPGLNGGVESTLGGDPYILAIDMPDIGAGNKALAYGDFMRGYEIFDRTGTMMIRDIFSRKTQAIIELTFIRWNTGRVIIPEALTILRIAA